MAGTDRTPLIEPERRYANLFAKRKGLTPPVKVEEVLRGYADIQHDSLPAGDAIMLRRSGRRPLVIVSNSQKGNRLRFTLAHELGHIVLPWQMGTAFCYLDGTLVASGDFHLDLEAQANRFATELLIPRAWLTKRLGSNAERLADRIIQMANEAEVSPITLSIALGSVCTFPAATCITDASGEPKYQTQSSHCRVRKELRWWDSPGISEQLGGQLTSAQFGEYALHTIVLTGSSNTKIRKPSGSSIEILEKILAKAPVSQQQDFRRQVNGVVGAANNYPEAQTSVVSLHGLLTQRFLGKSTLIAVTRHRLFPQFLEAKAHELYQRRHPLERGKKKVRR